MTPDELIATALLTLLALIAIYWLWQIVKDWRASRRGER